VVYFTQRSAELEKTMMMNVMEGFDIYQQVKCIIAGFLPLKSAENQILLCFENSSFQKPPPHRSLGL